MHYIICYDLASTPLRTKTAKALLRHGCSRVQRSVFVAPDLGKKDLLQLQACLQRLLAGQQAPGDSLLIVPLRDEHIKEIHTFGDNNILADLETFPLKIML